MDSILPHTRMLNASEPTLDSNLLLHHIDVSFQIKKIIYESFVKVFGARIEFTIESFMEEA